MPRGGRKTRPGDQSGQADRRSSRGRSRRRAAAVCVRRVPCLFARTLSSRCCTAPSERTAPSRACSRWPASPTSGRASSAAPSEWTRIRRKRCGSRRDFPSSPTSRCGESEWPRMEKRLPIIEEAEHRFRYPLFVKPSCAGSSVGAGKASNRAELEKAVAAAFVWDDKVLIEPFVQAREIRVLGDRQRNPGGVHARGSDADARILRLRGEIPRPERSRAAHSGQAGQRAHEDGPGDGRQGVSSRRAVGLGARRLLRQERLRRVAAQRGKHDAGFSPLSACFPRCARPPDSPTHFCSIA